MLNGGDNMWKMLPEEEKKEYKRMILAFASLTEMFAQKAENTEEVIELSPIINSKYQETVFQRAFHASAEDIGNTSYDAAIAYKDSTGKETKFLIGIKTFGVGSGSQKVAQFKANHSEWAAIINRIRENSRTENGETKTKDEINKANNELYLELAKKIAILRNARIKSSESNIQGFSVNEEKDNVQAVYHVLMPSKKGDPAEIYVGETDYAKIDVKNIQILGCTGVKNPTNFDFFDGNHIYRYTAADSQLLMDFKNQDIIQEKWDVVYADDAYLLFSNLADQIYGKPQSAIKESYSWLITNAEGEVELFSGFNSFYGVGSKLAINKRAKKIEAINIKFESSVKEEIRINMIKRLKAYLLHSASSKSEKLEKVQERKEIIKLAHDTNNKEFIDAIQRLVYRPKDELYIPIPRAKEFHLSHPDFFGSGIGSFKKNSNKLALNKIECEFNLIFEPSGDSIRSFITQDNGKAIESVEKQSYLGEWILRGVFQLAEFEPLTVARLNEIGINGIRIYKIDNKSDVHLQFIWINPECPPDDFIE